MTRIADTARGPAFSISVDGALLPAYQGETIAAVILAAGTARFRTDTAGAPRGLWCNMGSCGECMVSLAGRRVRACLTAATPGLAVTTHG